MSRIISKPPARFVVFARDQGHSNLIRNSGGQLTNSAKADGGAHGGRPDIHDRGFLMRWIDTIQINAAHEQPRLVSDSAAQPIIRWGYRRFVRTFMAAGPRFQGRWFYAGVIKNQYVARGRMTGQPAITGVSRTVPRFQTGPRVIPIGARKRR